MFNSVDTCGAEFQAFTPYLYSTYEGEDESKRTERKKIMILGGGPNRIGQGIEFDYCCVHAAFALKEEGYETIMVNCNPETVSTDYDTSDKLYFEPLTMEEVMNIVDREKPDGVIVQFGGQTPLKLALPLERAGVPIIGTSPDSIDLAEDRERFAELLKRLEIKQPDNGIARSYEAAFKIAEGLGYPVLVRPSYVLGGRAMQIVYDGEALKDYMLNAVSASPEHPVLIDKFLDDAIEIDVDALGRRGRLRDRRHHGAHRARRRSFGRQRVQSAAQVDRSGYPGRDPPPHRRFGQSFERARSHERAVCGPGRATFSSSKSIPRASRTVPFVSKAIGVPLAKLAARIMVGRKLRELGLTEEVHPKHISVKEAVFPFNKFPGVDTLLGPEMKSTGEVMGIDTSFGIAFAKAQLAAVCVCRRRAKFSSACATRTKPVRRRWRKNFTVSVSAIVATRGTAAFFAARGVPADIVNKVQDGSPHIGDQVKKGEIAMVINTPTDAHSHADSYHIRRWALDYQVPYFTTIAGAEAAAEGIEYLNHREFDVKALQDYGAPSLP